MSKETRFNSISRQVLYVLLALSMLLAFMPLLSDTVYADSISTQEVANHNAQVSKDLKVYQTGSKLSVEYGEVEGADSYKIYYAYCNTKFRSSNSKTVDGDTTSVSIYKISGKKLKLTKACKAYVVAYATEDGQKTQLAKSIIGHTACRKNAKYTNATGLKVLSAKVLYLNKGETSDIKIRTIVKKSRKKLLTDVHTTEFRYQSSDKSVATVSKNGRIQAKAAGTCYIFIYSRNGYAQAVKLTVKAPYTVVFLNIDGTVLQESTYNEGEVPVYEGKTPTYSDASYIYTFKGWDKDITEVTAAQTYVATYNKVARSNPPAPRTEKTKVEVPTAIEGLEYNGEVQTGIVYDKDSSIYEVSGVATATDAGTYKAIVSLKDKDKYVWKLADGTTTSDNQIITWSIASKIATTTIVEATDTTITVMPTVASPTSCDESATNTSVTFPASIKEFAQGAGQTASLTVEVFPLMETYYNTSGATNTDGVDPVNQDAFTISAEGLANNDRAIGALDLTVKINGNVVKEFKDSNDQPVAVKVTTYLAKQITDFGLSYTDSDGNITTWTDAESEAAVDAAGEYYYDPATGKLVFCTTHFSTFVVEGKDSVYDEEADTLYTLDELASATNSGTTFEGKTLTLLKDDSYFDGETEYNGTTTNWTTRIGTEVGSIKYPFKGTFEGNGHTITYKYVNTDGSEAKHYGLFGFIEGATIQNLKVAGYIGYTGELKQKMSAGGLVAQATDSTMTNISSNVELNCTYKAGGIAEQAIGTTVFSNCTYDGKITNGTEAYKAYSGTGGIVAYGNGAVTIEDCTTSGTIEGYQTNAGFGGIIGHAQSSGKFCTVVNCVSNMNISGNGFSAGGIAGFIGGKGNIQNCTNNGTVTSKGSNAAGILGDMNIDSNSADADSQIASCTNNGSISGNIAGGILGSTQMISDKKITIKNCSVNAATIQGTTYSGKWVGQVGKGTVTNNTNVFGGVVLYLPDEDDSSILSVGCIGDGTMDSMLTIEDGTLYGQPANATLAGAYVTLKAGTKWVRDSSTTITASSTNLRYRYNNGSWVQQ